MSNAIQIIASSIVEKITSAAKAGEKLPWQKPWLTIPFTNASSGHVFTGGFNKWSLAFLGQGDCLFATFKQIAASGGKLAKGALGIPLLLPLLVEDEKGPEGAKKCIGWRYYTVFGLSFVTGGKFKVSEPAQTPDFRPIAELENLIAGMGAEIRHGGNVACFNPSDKTIQMPNKTVFADEVAYYQVLIHELAHWSAEKVGQRDLSAEMKEDGFDKYGFEELRAEITACMVLSVFGIEPKVDNSAAYVQSWLSKLNDSPEWLVRAINQAEKRAAWILGDKEMEKEKAA